MGDLTDGMETMMALFVVAFLTIGALVGGLVVWWFQ